MKQVNQNRENLTLVLALCRCHQLFMRAVAPLFKQAGLTASQWDVLETLSSMGPLSVNDLLNSVLSSSGNMDVVVKNLIKSGLVKKGVAKEDRRSRVVSLTRAGKAKVNAFFPVHNSALEKIFEGLTAAEKRRQIKHFGLLRKQLTPEKKEMDSRCETVPY